MARMILQMSEAVNGMLAVAVAREGRRSEDDETEAQTKRRPRMRQWRRSSQRSFLSGLYGTESAVEYEMLTFTVCRDVEVSRRESERWTRLGPRTSLRFCGMTRTLALTTAWFPLSLGQLPGDARVKTKASHVVSPPRSRFAPGFRRELYRSCRVSAPLRGQLDSS